MQESNFVEPTEEENAMNFFADGPKGAVKRKPQGGQNDRAAKAPQKEIQNHRDIAYGDPHVHRAVRTIVNWTVGDGFSIAPRSFDEALTSGTAKLAADVATGDAKTASEDYQKSLAAKLNLLMQPSPFWPVFEDWVYYALVDGHSFMELVVEDGHFEPRLLPTEKMQRKTDEYGRIEEYRIKNPEGGGSGSGGKNYKSLKPHEVAELWFRKEPTDDFGRSAIEPIVEAADMLRDMEMDYTRFISTKAYPPILWKLGSEEEKWTPAQIDNWLDYVQQIEPDSMLGGPHDVEADVVGTTSTSSTAGAMRLEDTFKHFERRIVTGLGVPAIIMNMEGGGQGEAVSIMPSWRRYITTLQNRIKSNVEHQILRSLIDNSLEKAQSSGPAPEFQFGEHSAVEKRLEADVAINSMNNLLLTPRAAAERAGYDPDSELPDIWDNVDGQQQMQIIRELAGSGDNIQNPAGGSPTDTGGGAKSAGGEVVSRQNPNGDSSNGRKTKSVTQDESA